MKRVGTVAYAQVFLALGLSVFSCLAGTASGRPDPLLRLEQKHFLECLGFVYDPALWISYEAGLYFVTKNEIQDARLQEMKIARSRYVSFTDPKARHDLAATILARSGVKESWQRKLLLAYSPTNENQNLTPTLNRPLRIVPDYEVIQSATNGDVLIRVGDETEYFVMGLGPMVAGTVHTNALLIKEGWKTYTTTSGTPARVEAFTSVSLNSEETAVLNRVSNAFRTHAASFIQERVSATAAVSAVGSDLEAEFKAYLARASDSSPYFQYLVAKCYLEGKGTPKDPKLGLEWMKKAAGNGSGDAEAYLKH